MKGAACARGACRRVRSRSSGGWLALVVVCIVGEWSVAMAGTWARGALPCDTGGTWVQAAMVASSVLPVTGSRRGRGCVGIVTAGPLSGDLADARGASPPFWRSCLPCRGSFTRVAPAIGHGRLALSSARGMRVTLSTTVPSESNPAALRALQRPASRCRSCSL